MKLFWYKGRASRLEYFLVNLLVIVLSITITFVGIGGTLFNIISSVMQGQDPFSQLAVFASMGAMTMTMIILPVVYLLCNRLSLMVTIRRLHDMNKPGRWIFAYIGIILLFSGLIIILRPITFLIIIGVIGRWIYLQFFPGTKGENQYDKDYIGSTTPTNTTEKNQNTQPTTQTIPQTTNQMNNPPSGNTGSTLRIELTVTFVAIALAMGLLWSQFYALNKEVNDYIQTQTAVADDEEVYEALIQDINTTIQSLQSQLSGMQSDYDNTVSLINDKIQILQKQMEETQNNNNQITTGSIQTADYTQENTQENNNPNTEQ